MRILHIPHAYYPNTGGLEYIFARLSEELIRQGHTVEVLVSDAAYYRAMFEFGYSSITPAHEVVNQVPIQRFPFCATRWYRVGNTVMPLIKKLKWERLYWFLNYRVVQILGTQSATQSLADKIERFQPDVVVTAAHMLPNMKWVLELHRQHSFPLVQMPLIHYNVIESEKAIFAPALKAGTATVTLTQTEANICIQSYGLPQEKVFVGGIGTEIPEQLPLKSENDYVLFLSRKERYKGIEETIAAMRIVWRTLPHLKLVLAGPRTPQSDFLDSLLAGLPPSERANIVEIELVTGEKKSTLIRNALCLIFPSQSESFGIVLVEAMVHGTPPITWDIPLFREIVDHEQTGLLSEFGNTASLADALLTLAQNPNRAIEMGKAGREVVKRKYRWETIVQNYLTAYQFAYQSHSKAQPQQ